MSSPINGIGGAAPWPTAAGPAAAHPGQSGPSFAQVAAAAGLPAAGSGSGGTGSTGTPGSSASGAGGTGITGTGGTGTPGTAVGGTSLGSSGTTPGTAGSSSQGATGSNPLGQTGGLPGTGGTGSTTGSTTTGTIADLSGTDTFLKLLVAQLKNQDPTSPMDSQSFVTELAQFNTVEQMINLKTAMATQTTTQQANEGIGMLGRAVTYVMPGIGGNHPTTGQGTVSGVSLGGGIVTLQIGVHQVPLSQVTAVGGSGG